MKGSWSPWQEGVNGLSARIASDGRDTYPNNFRCQVEIRTADGKTHQRVGMGRYMGNFSPIWVRWKGENKQLTEILRGD